MYVVIAEIGTECFFGKTTGQSMGGFSNNP